MQRIILVEDNIKEYCLNCGKDKPVYQMYEGSDLLKRCSICERVHARYKDGQYLVETTTKPPSLKEQRELELERREQLRKSQQQVAA